MDHEVICSCQFMDQCQTFNDSLIGEERKGPSGFGCRSQSDFYRGKHCRTFACAYLSIVLSDAMRHPAPNTATRQ